MATKLQKYISNDVFGIGYEKFVLGNLMIHA